MGEIRRVSHCSHWGAYTVLVDGQKIVGVEPFADDPSPSPIIHSAANWLDPSRRISRPMVREGWLKSRRAGEIPSGEGRGRERFVPLDWDEALLLVAGEIDRVRTDHGNDAIFAGSYGWTSCGRFHHASSLLKRTLNLVGGFTGHVDTYSIAAGPVILRHTLGNEDACSGRSNTLDMIAEHTETLVIFGAMSPRTAQNEAGGIARHALADSLRDMMARGIRIFLVSPLRSDLPDWVEAEWLPIRPNTDTALMLALANEIVRQGRHDQDFLDRCTSGADVFLDYLSGAGDGVEKTPEWAEEITGIPAAAIRMLAERMPATRTMITVSWSLQRAHHGEQPFWAALGLACVIGQLGLPGGGVGYGYGSLGGVGAPFAIAKSPAISQLAKPNKAFIPVARITDILTRPGEIFSYEGRTYTYPDIKLVYWAGGNPFHHHQDLNRFSEAWKLPQTIVVQDPMWTATALRADIVLPASTSLERNDIAASRRSDRVVAMHKAVEPLGEARSDYDIFCGLAEKLGVADTFTEGRNEMAWLVHLYEECRRDAQDRFGYEMPSFDAFWEKGNASVPIKGRITYLEGFRKDPAANPLKTESGLIVLGSKMLQDLGYEDCRAHPAWMPPLEWLGNSTGGFHLMSHQPTGRLHSQIDNGPASAAFKRNGREQVTLNGKDAVRLGVRDGDAVRLWNDRGACLATAQLSEEVLPGVAVLPTGAWFTPAGEDGLEIAGNPNVLTPDIPTSLFGQGCSAHTCIVHIELYRGNAPDPAAHYLSELERLTGV